MRFLFYAINGRGLGHVSRTLNILKAFRRISGANEFLFSTDSPFAMKLHLYESNCLVLASQSIDRPAFCRQFAELVEEFMPDMAVFDGASSEFSALTHSFGIRNILILRKMDNASMLRLLRSGLGCFDLVIMPHFKGEMQKMTTRFIFNSLLETNKVVFAGPIVREVDPLFVGKTRKKYGIGKLFTVLGTFGGGGFDDLTEEFINRFIGAVELIGTPEIKFILVKGPYYGKLIEKRKNMVVVDFEPNLVELMSVSSLVVTHAGYNSVNEVIEAKVPSIVIPRPFNESYAEKQIDNTIKIRDNVLGVVFDSESSKSLANLILKFYQNKAYYQSIKENLANFSLPKGNAAAARAILEFASTKSEIHA